MSPPAAPPGLADRFALVLDGLGRMLAVRASRDRAASALMLLLWTRLRRTVQRLTALLARHQAGTLKPTRPRARRAAADRPPPPRLPQRFGWLVARAPETAAYGEYLRQLIEDPEMRALLEAAPQTGRLLRPLCRMLALRPPPALARTAPARPVAVAAQAGTDAGNQPPRRSPAMPRTASPRRRAVLPAWVPRVRRPVPA